MNWHCRIRSFTIRRTVLTCPQLLELLDYSGSAVLYMFLRKRLIGGIWHVTYERMR